MLERIDLSEVDVVILLWCNGRTFSGPWPLDFKKVINSKGDDIQLAEVGEEPVYLISTNL